MQTYKVGFLQERVTFTFEPGEITPIEDFDAAREWVNRSKHKDGFLYPPEVIQRLDDGTDVANSRRPAHLYHVPASHSLTCDLPVNSEDRHRTDASVIMQLIAYLFETWLQFDDWWFDARVPMRLPGLGASKTTTELFVSQSFAKWAVWPEMTKRRFVSALFMFNRAPSYEWDWEHFSAQYTVFDALYRTAVETDLIAEAKSHSERIRAFCNGLGLADSPEWVQEFVRLRNDLLHEAIWDGGLPGSAGGESAYMCQHHLRRLNQRAIPAIFGFSNEFVSSTWWSRSRTNFGTP
jgi:hypothetical protein